MPPIGGVDAAPGDVPVLLSGLIDPLLIDPVDEPVDEPGLEPRDLPRALVDEPVFDVPLLIELPDVPVPVVPIELPLIEPGAVLPMPAAPLPVEPGVAPVPAEPPGALPVIWALAAVASRAAVIAIIVFMASLLLSVMDGYCGVAAGVAELGASVPTRPSPIVPAVGAPMGGVTPVAGCGSVGTVATADGGEPRPDGVRPGGGMVPAGT